MEACDFRRNPQNWEAEVVKKVIGGKHVGIQCESISCMGFIKVAWKSGFKKAECRHLEEVGKHSIFPNKLGCHQMLYRTSLNQANANSIKERSKSSFDDNIESNRYIPVSMYDGNINYYSRCCRVAETTETERATLHCPCFRR